MCVIPGIGFSHVKMLFKSYCFNEKAKNNFNKKGSVLKNIEECFSLLQKFIFTVKASETQFIPVRNKL